MRKEIINVEGINGNPEGFIDTESEDFKLLQKAILEESNKQTPEQKRNIFLIGIRLTMEEYLESKEIKKIIPAGVFLKEILDEFNIKNNYFAEYIGLTKTNLSALIHGKRKINSELAHKLEAIFNIKLELWLGIEHKNYLIEVKKEPKKKYQKYKVNDLIPV
ncbi:MAG: helix-turn-helix domain-containing protein [Candidatus Sericytochromatia bacterium]